MTTAALVACSGEGRRADLAPDAPAPAPADVRDGTCADVADARVCWTPRGAAPKVAPRPVPDRPRPAGGWRCEGSGADRRCSPRRLGAGPFVCAGGECEQRYPRMPDDGEWECIDLVGVVLCRRGVEASGVVMGPPDIGWRCGPRANTTPAERICVDYAPDLPDDDVRSWRCRYEHDGGERRVCRKARKPSRIAAPCDTRTPCPKHLTCAAGRCLPHRPRPSCWFDTDCDADAACRLGTCVTGEAR